MAVLTTVNFQYLRISICIQVCQSLYFVVLVPRLLLSVSRIKVGGFLTKRVTCGKERDVMTTETSFVASKLSHRCIFVGHSYIRISYLMLNCRVVLVSGKFLRNVGTKLSKKHCVTSRKTTIFTDHQFSK
jgi:hypothetical protein